VSIGVSTLSAGDEHIDPLLNRADHALYEAKRGGRNRVAVDPSAS
jgi:diguanylate cyclase (GGDEF)-like protein